MNKRGLLASATTSTVVFLAVLFALLTPGVAQAVTVTTTTTITGWLIPDGAHFNTGIGALLFPLVGVGLFAGMGLVLDLQGDFGVTLILMGLTLGGVLAMLSINASGSNVIPFALVIVPALDLIMWMWKGNG